MADCKWKSNVEAWFDGNAEDTRGIEQHVQNCPRCREHLKQLEFIRKNIREMAQSAHIADARFPAFIEGIRSGITPDRRWYRGGIRAMVSVAAAALIVAGSVFLLLNDGAPGAEAVVVESVSTELEGATVRQYESDNGTTTVWVYMPEDDVW